MAATAVDVSSGSPMTSYGGFAHVKAQIQKWTQQLDSVSFLKQSGAHEDASRELEDLTRSVEVFFDTEVAESNYVGAVMDEDVEFDGPVAPSGFLCSSCVPKKGKSGGPHSQGTKQRNAMMEDEETLQLLSQFCIRLNESPEVQEIRADDSHIAELSAAPGPSVYRALKRVLTLDGEELPPETPGPNAGDGEGNRRGNGQRRLSAEAVKAVERVGERSHSIDNTPQTRTGGLTTEGQGTSPGIASSEGVRSPEVGGGPTVDGADAEDAEFLRGIESLWEEVRSAYEREKVLLANDLWLSLKKRIAEALRFRRNSATHASVSPQQLSASMFSHAQSQPPNSTYNRLVNLLHQYEKDTLIKELEVKAKWAADAFAVLSEGTEGWDYVKHKTHEFWSKKLPDGTYIFRCEGVMDQPVFNIVSILVEGDQHPTWCPFLESSQNWEITRVSQIVQHTYSLPWPFDKRYTNLLGFGVDALDDPDKECLMVPEIDPAKPRMDIHLFAFIMTPDPTGKPATKVQFFAKLDPNVSQSGSQAVT
uniref:START domain-containing protein n=1 Tax=Chromera velia CCMP2878 TaxID=1169474 RepID=A0A0K6S8A9_9ALVE|eukprot:Cvel_25036.t2-p1 / transcript=Cvel_25036.t2 / gene=Cvel_25036 / organism=Chromera_velia_CCMP2878 / gene_product=hypothetical protein / transcript_product=hypothetical protein / location=Cvel_scaffold2779:15390-24156(+) / protein_length=533 / sequence_SO=supercontig / SO=protein_coding / is_pseudo=false